MGEPENDVRHQNYGVLGDTPTRLADDQFYQVLASSHRRRLLYYLLENEESTLSELTSVLSGWELTPAKPMQTSADRSEIRLYLRHNHLPRLDDADLVEYDGETGTVRLESLHPQVRDIIKQSVQAEQRTAPG